MQKPSSSRFETWRNSPCFKEMVRDEMKEKGKNDQGGFI